MADSGNPEDLVSKVVVTGTDESLAKLNAYSDGGAKAFDKLNTSAQGAAAGVEKSAAKIDAAARTAKTGFDKIGQSGSALSQLPGHIKEIENAISNFTSKLPQLTQAVGRFSQRLALVGAAAGAAAIGLATAAAKIAKAADGQSDSLEKSTQKQIDANNASLQGQVAAINLESSQRGLFKQLQRGEITYTEYSKAVKKLNEDFKEQQRVAAEVENAQARVKEENDRLTKSLKDRQALNGLIETFGGPLTSSLLAFGRQVGGIHQQFIDAFGPGAAGIIDTISGVLSKNAAAIGQFFDTAGRQIDTLLKNNGPQIQKLLENIGKATASVFTGVINAAPGLIDFFNNVLVPAITKIGVAFDTVATAINAVFGTKLTGGSIVLIAILAQVTGSIRLLFTLLKVGGGAFKALISIVESVGVAIGEVFGIKAISQVTKFGGAVAKGGGPVKTFLAIIRTAIPLITTLGGVLAAALGIGLGPALIIIGLVTAALILLATSIDWKAFGAAASAAITSIIDFFGKLLQGAINIVTGTIAAFGQLNAFFDSLPGLIGQAFAALWNLITTGGQAAVDAVIAAWNATTAFFSNLFTGIGNLFKAGWALVVAGVTAAVENVKTNWQAVVDFFTTLTQTISQFFTDMWNAIVQAFQTAIDKVKGFFLQMFNDAMAKLQPILELLKAIAALASSIGGGGSESSPVTAASGGHIRGPGTPTSDSIPAWLSNGEFVVKARSVAKYGAGLLHAINSGSFKMPRFNMGGLVSSMITPQPRFAFADGGEVHNPASMRPLNLNLFGEQFNGLLAPEDVGERLTKYAVAKGTRSAGRKPAWVGRGRN